MFQFYGYLSQQQNMMQDYIRTSTYQRAMLSNVNDFLDKVNSFLSASFLLVICLLKSFWLNKSSKVLIRYQLLMNH